MSTCYYYAGEVSLAVADSFQNFYDDKNDVQTHFVAMWQHVVSEFASYKNVAGYDLFNEPNPGFLPIIAGSTSEAKLYGRLITAIRQAEQSAPNGLAHIVFFEPGAEWSFLGSDATPPPDFTGDTNIVFAPHNYCGSLALDSNIDDCFKRSKQHSADYQTTFWTGEWGFFSDPDGIAAPAKAFAKAEDDAITGSALWQWEQACGDPNTVSSVGAQPPAELYHLNEVKCPQSQQVGFVQQNEVVVSRSYPRAAPGHLTALQSDPDSGTLSLSGQTDQPGTAVLWFPDRQLGAPQVSGTGVSNAQVTAVNGGFVVSCTVSGAYTISLQSGG
jgi:endoglycosylceramidase